MHYHIRYQGSRTGWVKRTRAIDTNYRGGTRQLVTTEWEWARTVLAEVAKTEIEECRRKVHRKQNLQLYREHKKETAPCRQYWKDRASAQLFQALTDSLLTPRRKFQLYRGDSSCRLCGIDEETVQHILMQCKNIDQYGQRVMRCGAKQALDYRARAARPVERAHEKTRTGTRQKQ